MLHIAEEDIPDVTDEIVEQQLVSDGDESEVEGLHHHEDEHVANEGGGKVPEKFLLDLCFVLTFQEGYCREKRCKIHWTEEHGIDGDF